MPIQPARIWSLNAADPNPDGRYVLYWMQQSQRASYNHALEFAVERANAFGKPLLVCFGLTDGYPEANARHYAFMLQGLAEVDAALAKRGIDFALRRGAPDRVALDFAREAVLLVCDRGYLKPQKAWRATVAAEATISVIQVEADVVVPVETASPKHEVGARTLRPKLHRVWDEYLVPLQPKTLKVKVEAGALANSDFALADVAKLVSSLKVNHAVGPIRRFRGGETEARRRLRAYLAGPFEHYGRDRGLPEAGAASHMSPYLHFGQISPVEIALAVRDAKVGGPEDRSAYLEELIVRRELAMNHVFYAENYDDYGAMPGWARTSLDQARHDKRPYLYTVEQLAQGATHDRHWNASMQEMRETGYMHNHMRMYWGKKILEWSPSPEEAFDTTLRLNNRFFIDGRDANSFTNVGWLFGLHDRPWFRRPIFGVVRYMGAATLKKFDSNGYVSTVERLAAAER
jgi:deoxyribodipyrimidine photo-lyase